MLAVVDRLVGVIDLHNGQCVHAVAGHRDLYRPVSRTDGSAPALAQHYHSLGIDRLYIADLDAIVCGRPQETRIAELCESFPDHQISLDVGWTGEPNAPVAAAATRLALRFNHLRLIAGTESLRDADGLKRLVDRVSPQRVLLSLDFRNHAIVGQVADQETWIGLASELSLHGIIVLDLRTVGAASGPITHSVCQSIRRADADRLVYSGGGIRHAEDVAGLIDAGCHACLVATALHGLDPMQNV